MNDFAPQIDRLNALTHDFKLIRTTLNAHSKAAQDIINKVKAIHLPNLDTLLHGMVLLTEELYKNMLTCDATLADYLHQIAETSLKINSIIDLSNQNQKIYHALLDEEKNYASMFKHCLTRAHDKSALYLAKSVKSDPYQNLGTGLDIVIEEHLPRSEEQVYSLQQQINLTKAHLANTDKEIKDYIKKVQSFIDEMGVQHKAIQMRSDEIKTKITTLFACMNEFSLLEHIYQSNSIYGAAARNDLQQVLDILAQGADPNALDQHGKKAIFYAARLGSLETVLTLLECTKLSKHDKNHLLDAFPQKNTDGYHTLVSRLNPENTYIHLYKRDTCPGDVIKKVFKDFYSPQLLDGFSLSDPLKLKLTLNWGRSQQEIEVAKKMVNMLLTLESEDMEDVVLCKRLFDAKLKTYSKSNLLDPQSELAKRFYHVNVRLNQLLTESLKTTIYSGNYNPCFYPSFAKKCVDQAPIPTLQPTPVIR